MSGEKNKTKGLIVIFASNGSRGQSATGAIVGTKVIVAELEKNYEIKWIPLEAAGLKSAQAATIAEKLRARLSAMRLGLRSLIRLAAEMTHTPKANIVYFLPSSSTGGAARDLVVISAVRLLNRRAMLIGHLRNGNYFCSDGWVTSWLRRLVADSCDKVIVLSPRLLEIQGGRIGNRSKVHIIPNTIDDDLIPLLPSLMARCATKKVRVLFLSNFIESKGYRDLLAAAEVLINEGCAEEFSLTFRGKWPNEQVRKKFEDDARTLSALGCDITVGGEARSRREVQSLYFHSDVFCLPTRYQAEAQPRSILEAMANGCTIVSTNFRAVPDMVVDGENGFLISDGGCSELAGALRKAIQSDTRQLGRRSREIFDEKFSPQVVGEMLREVF